MLDRRTGRGCMLHLAPSYLLPLAHHGLPPGGVVGLAVPGALPTHLRTSSLARSPPDGLRRCRGAALSAWGGVGFWEAKPCSPWEGIQRRFRAELLLFFLVHLLPRGRK